jgi:hypothetical protein
MRASARLENGAVAQLGERLLCKQDVVGSIPSGSTIPSAFEERTSSRPRAGLYIVKRGSLS